ncbi:hypothetical protein [Burkholderia vietnamiensis]|uniref:hypothetical protein n=1 Tax=Burkholderia vietnamiensis TaxID=60552 RepID=UPI000A912888|nr:hypothetical protein [Burkholderia vietnamiensis]MBR7998892.1 hypothetical protein [Burkholderia vietnamiensis]MBR8083467.1 hypothetical protein [Burkholderia vietnamiensis]MCA7945338.1 hypothetical protein [Burkholderia vietnamiensis]MDN8065909.1 hypothetical protein [Burkholderia vietnamiensis]HDR8920130.1 hypothetical protein [Burkholderia vietnamiensis]
MSQIVIFKRPRRSRVGAQRKRVRAAAAVQVQHAAVGRRTVTTIASGLRTVRLARLVTRAFQQSTSDAEASKPSAPGIRTCENAARAVLVARSILRRNIRCSVGRRLSHRPRHAFI